MDWGIVFYCISAGVTAASIWKVYRMKKEVCVFENRVEKALDEILTEQQAEGQAAEWKIENSINQTESLTEELSDTLWGKCSEKIARVSQICKKKEVQNRKEKSQIKELIADISHQTRTPIANIRLYVEFLQEEPLSEKGMEFLKNLEGQTEKLNFLLQSMVKMSRLEAGVIQIKCERKPLYETIAKAAAEVVPSAAKKKILLSVDCDENITVWHDRKWIEEAVFNVLDNAVKYTEKGGHVTVYVVRQELFTRISICDDGKGILQERQAAIFKRFYREPEIHEQRGIGIGLYLTRQILELQNGYIEVHSEPGQGSEFCLYLPNDSMQSRDHQ